MQLPREARWSRSSAVIFSVVAHVAIFLALGHWVYKPAVKERGPLFQIFQLDAKPETAPPPISHPPERVNVDPPIVDATPPQASLLDRLQGDEPSPSVFTPRLVQPDGVPTVLPPPGQAVTAPSTMSAPPRTAAERLLRTGTSPVPLPGRPGAIPDAVSPQDAASARMFAGVKEINDSIAAALADADHSQDWVKKGKDGKKWGVSPGGIHIGSVTLPLPNFGFSGPPGRRDETAGKVRSFAESNAQAQRIEMEQTFESRVKAMRARKDAERDSTRSAKKTGG